MSIDTATAELADAVAERVARLLSSHPPAPTPWLDQEAAGKYIGKNGLYLQHLRHQKRGPPYVLVSQKMVRYALADIQEWMLAREVRPGS